LRTARTRLTWVYSVWAATDAKPAVGVQGGGGPV